MELAVLYASPFLTLLSLTGTLGTYLCSHSSLKSIILKFQEPKYSRGLPGIVPHVPAKHHLQVPLLQKLHESYGNLTHVAKTTLASRNKNKEKASQSTLAFGDFGKADVP